MTEYDPVLSHYVGRTCRACGFTLNVTYRTPDDGEPQDQADEVLTALVLAGQEHHLRERHPDLYREAMRGRILSGKRGPARLPNGEPIPNSTECEVEGCPFAFVLAEHEPDAEDRLTDVLWGHIAAVHYAIWKEFSA